MWGSQLHPRELHRKAEGRRDTQGGGAVIGQTRSRLRRPPSGQRRSRPSDPLCLLLGFAFQLVRSSVGKTGCCLQTPENPTTVSPAERPCRPIWKASSHDGELIETGRLSWAQALLSCWILVAPAGTSSSLRLQGSLGAETPRQIRDTHYGPTGTSGREGNPEDCVACVNCVSRDPLLQETSSSSFFP